MCGASHLSCFYKHGLVCFPFMMDSTQISFWICGCSVLPKSMVIYRRRHWWEDGGHVSTACVAAWGTVKGDSVDATIGGGGRRPRVLGVGGCMGRCWRPISGRRRWWEDRGYVSKASVATWGTADRKYLGTAVGGRTEATFPLRKIVGRFFLIFSGNNA